MPQPTLEYDREFQRQIRREMRHRRIRRQRMIGAGTAVALVLGVAAVLSLHHAPATRATAAKTHKKPPAPPHLPRGGRVILPNFRVVAYDGAPQTAALGVLGDGTPAQAAARLEAQAEAYARPGRPVLPAMELITTVAQADPGVDGMYRMRQSNQVIARYLKAVRRIKGLLILDIQPGRSSFLSELRSFRQWLRLPDVGVALDPEWSMRPGQIPGQVIGSTTGTVVNRVAAMLAHIVKVGNLPQKLLIVHRFTPDMIAHQGLIHPYPGVATVINIDGFGDRPNKISKYNELASHRPGIGNGFKLFYTQDTDLMPPRLVLALRPSPDVIVYE
jgi:hypothetical protein